MNAENYSVGGIMFKATANMISSMNDQQVFMDGGVKIELLERKGYEFKVVDGSGRVVDDIELNVDSDGELNNFVYGFISALRLKEKGAK